MELGTQVEPMTAGRLAALAKTYNDAREVVDVHRERLHEAVTEAADAGMGMPAIARAIGVSTTRVYGIVARIYRKN